MQLSRWWQATLTICLLATGHAEPAPSTTVGTVSPALTSYPDPQCKKPEVKLVKPGVWNDQSGAVERYNAKVRKFNADVASYGECMHAYIDKANLDVKAIQDKANADLRQITERANASMKIIQDKIKQAVSDGKSVAADLNRQTADLKDSDARHH